MVTQAITNLASSGNTVNVTEPSGLVDDDIILIWCAVDGNPTGFASAGFDLVFEDIFTDSTPALALLIKRASGEAGAYTVTWGGGGEQGRFMSQRVSGCRVGGTQLDVIDVISTETEANSTSITATELISTEAETLVISGCAVDRDRVDSGDTASTNSFVTVGTSGSSGGAGGAGLISGEKDLSGVGGSGSCLFGTWATGDTIVARIVNLGSIEPSAVTGQFVSMGGGDMD